MIFGYILQDLFLLIAGIAAERPADWPWDKPLVPSVFGLLE